MRIINGHGELRKSLELGCGVARYSLAMATEAKIPEIVGVDICETAIVKAANLFKRSRINADFVIADVCSSPFRSGSFDFVHSQGLYEHFHGYSRQKVVQESVRVLSPGGLLFFVVPNKLSVSYNLKRFIAELRQEWMFWDEKSYTLKEALTRVRKLPMVIEKVGGVRLLTGYIRLLSPLSKLLKKALNISVDNLLRSYYRQDYGIGQTHAILAEGLFVLGKRIQQCDTQGLWRVR